MMLIFSLIQTKKNTILFENEMEYGRNALVITEEGYLQYLTEFREYTFNYVPQSNDEITISGEMGTTSLYVNGEFVEKIGSNNPFEFHGTFVFPMTLNENAINRSSLSYTKNR